VLVSELYGLTGEEADSKHPLGWWRGGITEGTENTDHTEGASVISVVSVESVIQWTHGDWCAGVWVVWVDGGGDWGGGGTESL